MQLGETVATGSKAAYDRNSHRARYFLKIHEDVQAGQGAPLLRYRELPRAALVFSVGALDAYLSELSAEVMVRQFQAELANKDARGALERIQKEVPTLALEVAVLPTQEARIQRIKDAIGDYFNNSVSNHGQKAVSATLARIGCQQNQLWDHLLGLGYADPREYLDRWTDARHQIVHQGLRPRVRRTQAYYFIGFADALVARIDNLSEAV